MLTQYGHGLASGSGYANGCNIDDGSADGSTSLYGNGTCIVDKHNDELQAYHDKHKLTDCASGKGAKSGCSQPNGLACGKGSKYGNDDYCDPHGSSYFPV